MNKFKLFALFGLALSGLALAEEQENVPVNMKCISQTPTTSFIAKTEGDLVKVTVVHHNGVKYMPIFTGIVTPADLAMLQKRSEVMQKLGDRIELQFDKANCKKYGKDLYSCGLGSLLGDSGVKVDRASILTKTSTERLYDIEFAKNSVSVGLTIEGSYYSIDNDFYYETCRFE